MKRIIEEISKNRYWILACVVCLLFGFCLGYYVKSIVGEAKTEVNSVSNSNNEVNSEKDLERCDMQIDVSGAVKKPNVYCLDKEAIVLDAVAKSGGFHKEYAQKYVSAEVNLAQKLVEGQKIYIPFAKEVKCSKYQFILAPTLSNTQSELSNACVNINTGSLANLMKLNGVGQALAQKIIDGRPYKNIVDLDNVSGIGEQMLLKLKPDVCI